MRTSFAISIGFLLLLPAAVSAQAPPTAGARQEAKAATTEQATVPADLRPLLGAPQSEIRLVRTRYTLDRATLTANYLGGMRPPGGRGGERTGERDVRPTPEARDVRPAPGERDVRPAPVLSPNRLARLKRFDLDWQAALAGLDAGRLSAAGKTDLADLRKLVASNLAELDTQASALAEVSPLVPFAPAIVKLVEARIRLEDIDAEKAAGAVTEVTRQVAALGSRIEAGAGAAPGGAAAGGAGTSEPLRVGKELSLRGAAAADTLRAALAEWFTFYNGYDPLFTWWMGTPYKHADAALQGYASLLRDKVAPADLQSPNLPAPAAAPIAPAAPPRDPSVPNLAELVALPQDEMLPVVQRFRAAIGRGGRGGPGDDAAKPAPPRDRAFFEAWLAALKTLDFDALSRNAQVDYLFIRTTAEQQIARLGTTRPSNPPRKTDATGITGPARGRQGLLFDLQDELIPYAPEELIALAEKEFAWCEREMRAASRQMGLGDDWKRALEKVKAIHPPPGRQAAVVRDLMFEAVDYLRAKDLLTVPPVAAESLRMIMMTPERQLVNPFFTGGSLISVSYPTDTMEYDARVQSMRGNNTPFSHATAFHEMIPGHNLVFYTNARFAGYRASLAGNSPFYSEGWPLYWELLLYDLGFDDTPEKKVGALFWRMHRCARIVFSLKFHLGEWSPQECIDYLVDRVGFERDNATAEVRRSFQGDYVPLYQAAYLLGGIQLHALRRELVNTRTMPQKRFHDEILRQGSMPIALLRLAIGRQKLTRDMAVEWKFAG